jgi:hypothetical protein
MARVNTEFFLWNEFPVNIGKAARLHVVDTMLVADVEQFSIKCLVTHRRIRDTWLTIDFHQTKVISLESAFNLYNFWTITNGLEN